MHAAHQQSADRASDNHVRWRHANGLAEPDHDSARNNPGDGCGPGGDGRVAIHDFTLLSSAAFRSSVESTDTLRMSGAIETVRKNECQPSDIV